jgi:CDP-diacylglycerol--glycerol-3-phosphate 3-phosphatidyltransferase
VLFAWGFSLPLYLFSIGFGVFAYMEKCAILLIVDEVRSDMKGLYWILRSKKAQAW